MSSGGNLPYQLRPNKAVERLLFLDLLSRLDNVFNIDREYDYYGFGGPQMEEFRVLHERFPAMPMLSIEMDSEVLKRQKFNGPHTNVRCKKIASGAFVERHQFKRKSVIWLDYVKPGERPQQVAEFQKLLKKVPENSVVKLTLNATASTLGGASGPTLQSDRTRRFLSHFDWCFPNGLDEGEIVQTRFPATLLKVLEVAAAEAFRDRVDWRFKPLLSTVYADGQTMLTVTGIVGLRTTLEDMLLLSELSNWSFSRMQWSDPVFIEVPDLTIKERIFINQLLPKNANDVEYIHRKLGFRVGEDVNDSRRKIANYVSFHRHYPHFGRISI